MEGVLVEVEVVRPLVVFDAGILPKCKVIVPGMRRRN